MDIKTVPLSPYSPDLVPCDFWLFPKLTGCRYETIGEMKEAVTKVIDTLTQEDFHESFQKLLERHNKCIATGGDYFEGDKSFICELLIKVPIRKKSLETNLMIHVYQSSEITICSPPRNVIVNFWFMIEEEYFTFSLLPSSFLLGLNKINVLLINDFFGIININLT